MSFKHEKEPKAYARAWIADTEDYRLHLGKLCLREPEAAWALIKEVCDQRPSAEILGRLATGSLEDLLYEHGKQVIGRIEELGRRDERFAWVLAQVPQRGMPAEVWRGVRRAVQKWPGGKPQEHPTDPRKKARKAKAKGHEQAGLGL
jgi:hypothetical protein